MKKAVAFLLAFLIFVAPVTTLVKADVVIGDNDNTIINENATILGRKLALMESFSDLALSGVTEFTISNTNDLDSYLDSLWQEINSAIDSLSDGTGFQEISDTLKSKYFTNLVQYKDYINNRGDYLSYTFQNPATSFLSTYFADNIYGKGTITKNNLSLPAFQALSRYNNVITPTPDPDYLSIINYINPPFFNQYPSITYPVQAYLTADLDTTSFVRGSRSYSNFQNGGGFYNQGTTGILGISRLDVYINYDSATNLYYITNSGIEPKIVWQYTAYGSTYNREYAEIQNNSGWQFISTPQVNNLYSFNYSSYNTSSSTLQSALEYVRNTFSNINLYVNGDLWLGSAGDNSPTLDIDGFLKIFGNDTPQQYDLQPNTQIDYDQLYQVIYNAIRDNLPISQGDINYYDSHDTIYSPTIINNYGEEEGDESDLIDTILDYAVIPKFDTAIAQPMRAALTNGVVIMQNSITNVIPNEILLVLGACFFLLLFAVVINRMIK